MVLTKQEILYGNFSNSGFGIDFCEGNHHRSDGCSPVRLTDDEVLEVINSIKKELALNNGKVLRISNLIAKLEESVK